MIEHNHKAADTRRITHADGAVRVIETCACRAYRITTHETDGKVTAENWTHLESERAG